MVGQHANDCDGAVIIRVLVECPGSPNSVDVVVDELDLRPVGEPFSLELFPLRPIKLPT